MSSKRRKQPRPRQVVQDHYLLTQAFEKEISADYDSHWLRSFDNHICGRCFAEFYTMPAFLMHKKQCTNVWPVVMVSLSSSPPEETGTKTNETIYCGNGDENDGGNINETEIGADKSVDLFENSSKPIDEDENMKNVSDDRIRSTSPSSRLDCRKGVERIQSALASLQRQQMLQLQLIKHIYGQLLKSKKSFDDEEDVDYENDAKKCQQFAFDCINNNNSNTDDDDTTGGVSFDSLKYRVMSSLKELERNVTQQLNQQRQANVRLDKLYATRCQLCQKNVGNFKRLELHLKKVHNTEVAYFTHFCDKCYQCFTSESDLNEHSENDHCGEKILSILDDKYKENDVVVKICEEHDENTMRNDNEERNQQTSAERYILTDLNETTIEKHDGERCLRNWSPDFSASDHFPNDSLSANESCTSSAINSDKAPLDLSQNGPPTMVNLSCNTNFDQFAEDDELTYVNISTPLEEELDEEQRNLQETKPPFLEADNRVQLEELDDDEDWETLMEVTNTDEAAKIRQLAGNVPPKLIDPNQCIICQRILSCKSALQMHYRTHTGSRPFKCKVCQRAFTTKGNLKTHMSVHKTKAPLRMLHQCPLCQKAFTNAVILHQHLLNHNTDKIEITPVDNAVFDEAFPNVRTSVITALNGKLPTPKSSFVNGGSQLDVTDNVAAPVLNAPKVNNTNNFVGDARRKDNLPLSSDMEQPSSTYDLSPHSSSLGEPRFQSPYLLPGCNPFNSVMSQNLQEIINRSAGRPDTTCNVCLKTFACYSALEIHYRSHTKEKPFKCNFCARGFSTKGNLKQHLLTHKLHDSSHSVSSNSPHMNHQKQRYESLEADFVTPSLSVRVENGAKVSSRSFSEPNSSIAAAVINSASLHNGKSSCTLTPLESIQNMWARTDNAPPAAAKVAETNKPGLTPSASSALNNKHLCQVCLKNFSSGSALQIHMRTHTGDRPFVCKVCSRSFTTKGNLKVHMGTHSYSGERCRGRRCFSASSPEGLHLFDKTKDIGNLSSKFMSNNNEKIVEESSQAVNSSVLPTRRQSASNDVSSSFNAIMQNNFPHAQNFVPLSPPFFETQSPLGLNPFGSADFSSAFQQANSMSSSLNGFITPNSSADKSAEAMLMMWRTVCSVCHKVCGSAAELEIHLKNHLRQVDLNAHNVLKI